MKEYDSEELARFDGKDGKPVYIAHRGKIYDVSESKLWKSGIHMKRHHAARELGTDILAAPHGIEVLERVPQVGVLKEKAAADERKLPPLVAAALRRVPMLRRHPHPMTVHFPIAFMIMVPVFNILYLASGVNSLETTALHCLAAGLVFTPVTISTGFFSWWLNYESRRMRAFSIKQWCSGGMFVAALAAFAWRLAVPGVMHTFGVGSAVYFVLTLSLAAFVMVIGWFGAGLTFPVETE